MTGYDKARQALKQVYPKSKRWATKVDKMSDSQVIAIYIRMFNEGKIK